MLFYLYAVRDQRGQVRNLKCNSWRGLAVVFDVGRFVAVMWKGLRQGRIFGMWLCIIPAKARALVPDCVTVVE